MKKKHVLARNSAAIALIALAGQAMAQSGTVVGPSTTQNPYVIPADPTSGVVIYSIISNGNGQTANASGPNTPNETYPLLGGASGATYRMVGVPDGLGAYANGDGTFTLLMNHEIGNTAGVVRASGNRGSFVSQWVINANPGAGFLSVQGGRDLTTTNYLNPTGGSSWAAYNSASPMPVYNSSTGVLAAAPNAGFDGLTRLCSGDLAPTTAYAWTDPSTGTSYGTSSRIFMSGEEAGQHGRVFAHIATGADARSSWELPALGHFSWENAVANPFSQRNTIVLGTDDSTPGNLYVWVGQKQSAGNDVQRAGLTSGTLYGISMTGTTVASGQNTESRQFVLGNSSTGVRTSAPFGLIAANASNNVTAAAPTGPQLQALDTQGQMNFLRPEDISWDPSNPARALFVTTDSITGNSRLWSMTFNDITNPANGGNISMLMDGSNLAGTLAGGFRSASGLSDVRMMDNICVTANGLVLIQEDVGNDPRLGRIWLYNIATDSVVEVATHDPARFTSAAANGAQFLTTDEESSGIIDASSIMGPGWFLFDVQAHYSIGGELSEGGQLLAMYVPEAVPTPGAAALIALGGLAATRRKR
jgi:MYXO-CTERM domain-containing protein